MPENHGHIANALSTIAVTHTWKKDYDKAETVLNELLEMAQVLEPPEQALKFKIQALVTMAVVDRLQHEFDGAREKYQQLFRICRKHEGQCPQVESIQASYAGLLAHLGNSSTALALMSSLDSDLMGIWHSFVYGTPQESLRRHLVGMSSDLPSMTVSLALLMKTEAAARAAANVMLRWKHMLGEEEAFLAHFARTAEEPEVRKLGADVARFRNRLALAARHVTEPGAGRKSSTRA